MFEVADTGIGIDSERMKHLFSPFARAHAEQKQFTGTGLGLVICRDLSTLQLLLLLLLLLGTAEHLTRALHGVCACAVQLLGGDISLTSVVGQGTTFRIVLPLVPSTNMENENAWTLDLNNRHILSLDDTLPTSDFLSQLLTFWNVPHRSVIMTADESQRSMLTDALAEAQQREHPFDLVIISQKNAEQSLRLASVVSKSCRLPTLLMVPLTEQRPKFEMQANRLGVSAVLSQPIHFSQLASVLHRIFQHSGAPDPRRSSVDTNSMPSTPGSTSPRSARAHSDVRGSYSVPSLASTSTTSLASSALEPPPRAHSMSPPVTASEDVHMPVVLVVDDVKTNRAVALRLLQKLGCVVDVACDGSQAVEAVRTKQYDLVFMVRAWPARGRSNAG